MWYHTCVANLKTVGAFCVNPTEDGITNLILLYVCARPCLWTGTLIFGGEFNLPSDKVLEQKKQIVADLTEELKASCVGVVVDYKGTNVSDDTTLRKELREAGVHYTVVKNTLLGLAADNAGLSEMKDVLEGTTAIAMSADDYTAAARILKKFADTHESFNIKCGFLDGKVIDVATVESLAKLPSREILLATVLGAFNAPMAAFARAVQAIVDKENDTPAE